MLRRFITTQSDVPETLRSCYGIAYLVQDLAFVEALLAGRPAAPSMRVGLEAQRLAAAAYQAARTGEEVELATFLPDGGRL